MASKLNAANKKNIDAPILLLMGGYAAPTIELKIQSIKIESDWAADLKNCLNKKKMLALLPFGYIKKLGCYESWYRSHSDLKWYNKYVNESNSNIG